MPAFTRRLPELLFDTRPIEPEIGGERAREEQSALMEAESSKSQGDRA